MENIALGDIILLSGIISLIGLAVITSTIVKGISYKKTRRIPPYSKK